MLSGALAIAGCAREIAEETAPSGDTVLTAGVADEVASRTTFSDTGSFSWTDGDDISVYATDGAFHTFSLSSKSADGKTGTFVGNLGEATVSSVALYPASDGHALSGTAVTLNLPASYEWKGDGNSHAPMVATVTGEEGETIAFKHVGGLVKVTFENVPSAASKLVFTAPGKKIAGDFAIADFAAEKAEIATEESEEGNTVSFSFSTPSDEMSFYIPLPTGTYESFSVSLEDAAGNVYGSKERKTALTVSRASFTIMKAIALPVPTGKLMYFDFGHTDATGNECEDTEGADVNGHYWNNILKANATNVGGKDLSFNLIYADNSATAYTLTLTTAWNSNGKTHGGLLDPSADLLGDLAIPTATEDYFFSNGASTFTMAISGLDVAKGYKFYMFGSRSATDDRVAQYTVTGSNSFTGKHQVAGANLGGPGINQNNSTIFETPVIYPDAFGTITVSVGQGDTKTSNRYYQLNCMKVEEYEGGEVEEAVVYESLELSGAASPEGSVIFHKATTDSGNSMIFEAVTTFASGDLTLTATDDKGKTHNLVIADGAVSETAGATACTTDGVALLTVDLSSMTATWQTIGSILIQGPAVKGWSNTNGAELAYAGNGIFSGEALDFPGSSLTTASAVSDPSRINFLFKGSWNPTIKRITGTRREVEINTDAVTTEDIRVNPGCYDVTLDLRAFNFDIAYHEGPVPERITVMGSSVPRGYSATSYRGYPFLYEDVLKDRYSSGASTTAWYISNISVPSDNTTKVTDRYDELLVDGGSYVIFALSLGNEGIHEATDKQAVYDQWKTNMQALIARAREDGKYPIVTGNYSRADFTTEDYSYIKRMNIDIHKWDVPSVNLLGANDNGSGNWVGGYDAGDTYHPNNSGHIEFAHALVPSLFDAIKAGKDLPTRSSSGSYTVSNAQVIKLVPEDIVHPFTVSFGVKTSASGKIMSIVSGTDVIDLSIESAGTLSYGTLSGTTAVNDNKWHTVTLSHYFALGKTFLYVDMTLQGEVEEKLTATALYFGCRDAVTTHNFREIFFWRSGMNADEVTALNQGAMLKSSLEVYAPLATGLENTAQSLNTLSVVSGSEVTGGEDTFVRLNGEILTDEGSAYSISKIALVKDGEITTANLDLGDYYMDPDYFYTEGETLKFNAVSGLYNVSFNTADKYVTVRRVDESGAFPNLENGGLYLLGWGFAHPKMSGGQFGWTLSNSYSIAEVSEGVYQFSGYAVAETSTLMGGRFRTDYIGGKVFYEYGGWTGPSGGSFAFTEGAAKLIKQTDGGDFALADGVTLEDGGFYVLTLDFTECTVSGTSVTGSPKVDFIKK